MPGNMSGSGVQMRKNPIHSLLNAGPDRPMTEKNPNSVEAVKVAVRVLDELALQQRPMGVTELADALGETKPRVHRHLSTLKELGRASVRERVCQCLELPVVAVHFTKKKK